jgi:hypothetical protein
MEDDKMCEELYVDGDVTAAFEVRAKSSRTKKLFARCPVKVERYQEPVDPDATVDELLQVIREDCEVDIAAEDGLQGEELENVMVSLAAEVAHADQDTVAMYRISVDDGIVVDKLETPREVFTMLRGIAIGKGFTRV